MSKVTRIRVDVSYVDDHGKNQIGTFTQQFPAGLTETKFAIPGAGAQFHVTAAPKLLAPKASKTMTRDEALEMSTVQMLAPDEQDLIDRLTALDFPDLGELVTKRDWTSAAITWLGNQRSLLPAAAPATQKSRLKYRQCDVCARRHRVGNQFNGKPSKCCSAACQEILTERERDAADARRARAQASPPKPAKPQIPDDPIVRRARAPKPLHDPVVLAGAVQPAPRSSGDAPRTKGRTSTGPRTRKTGRRS